MTTHREVIRTDDVAIGVDDVAGRHLRLVLRLGNNLLGQSGGFIGLCTESNALDNVVELQPTGILGDDDGIERIPLGNLVALLDGVAILEIKRRTVGDVDRREDNLGIDIDKAEFAKTADYHLTLASVLVEGNRTDFLQLYLSVILGHDAGIGCSIGCHTTGVERTQRQLSTRLTDSLGGNHTDSLTLLYHPAGGKVATVTLHADTMLGLAGEHGTNLDALDGRVFDHLGDGFCNLLASSHDELAGRGMDDVVYTDTAQDALIEG